MIATWVELIVLKAMYYSFWRSSSCHLDQDEDIVIEAEKGQQKIRDLHMAYLQLKKVIDAP